MHTVRAGEIIERCEHMKKSEKYPNNVFNEYLHWEHDYMFPVQRRYFRHSLPLLKSSDRTEV